MSFFYYDVRVPDDKYQPKKHSIEELDALKLSQDKRDTCRDYYAEFRKCTMVQHQTKSVLKWKRAD